MKKYILLVFGLLLLHRAGAQTHNDSLITDTLQHYELQLMGMGKELINSPDERTRISSTYFFIKTLVMAFKVRGSYNFPFDSVKSVSILKPPDNTFRIFTWNLRLDNGQYRCYGAIQMNPDKMKVNREQEDPTEGKGFFPLIDRSDSISNPLDTTVNNEFWYGALYYQILQRKVGKQTYYFLFGFDGSGARSDKKLIDVLTFIDGKPWFGAPFFKVNDKKILSRFIMEYSQEASVSLRYLPHDKLIAYDHLLTPSSREIHMPETYVPDGTYDYFEWEKNMWVKREFLFERKKIKNEHLTDEQNDRK